MHKEVCLVLAQIGPTAHIFLHSQCLNSAPLHGDHHILSFKKSTVRRLFVFRFCAQRTQYRSSLPFYLCKRLEMGTNCNLMVQSFLLQLPCRCSMSTVPSSLLPPLCTHSFPGEGTLPSMPPQCDCPPTNLSVCFPPLTSIYLDKTGQGSTQPCFSVGSHKRSQRIVCIVDFVSSLHLIGSGSPWFLSLSKLLLEMPGLEMEDLCMSSMCFTH